MDLLWLSIGVLIGWIAAWSLDFSGRSQDQREICSTPGMARKLNAHRWLRFHVFRAVVTLVLIGVVLTVWSMRTGL